MLRGVVEARRADDQNVSWVLRRETGRLATLLADGECVLAVSDCVPLGHVDDALADGPLRTAVLSDRSLYCRVGEADPIPLPFSRMHELRRRGLSLLFFRIDDSYATWELRDHRFAQRAQRCFSARALAAHRNWVGSAGGPGQEPAAFRHHAHIDLLQRLAAGTDIVEAVLEQRAVVDELVFHRTGDRASARAALGRLSRVHRALHVDMKQMAEAAPRLEPAQHAQILQDQPSPWERPPGPVVDELTDRPDLAGLVHDVAPMGGANVRPET